MNGKIKLLYNKSLLNLWSIAIPIYNS